MYQKLGASWSVCSNSLNKSVDMCSVILILLLLTIALLLVLLLGVLRAAMLRVALLRNPMVVLLRVATHHQHRDPMTMISMDDRCC